MILNNDELKEEHLIRQTAEDRIQLYIKPPVTLIVHTLHEVNTALAEGQYFFSDIKKEGIALYEFDARKLAGAKNLTATESKEIAERHFRRWSKSGDSFLKGTHFYIQEKDLEKAAFMLHQAAETYYSCVMLVFTNYKPSTHSLVHLNNMVILQDLRFTEAFPQGSRRARSRFQLLKRAYIDACYSEHFEINMEQLEWLIERVEVLQRLTKELCQERIPTLIED